MDRLTRDAIDERIRVLEGVNGVVHRCLEELLRLRSVLPPVVTAPVPAEAGAAPASTAAGSSGLAGAASATPRENARDVKGKGKEVEPAAATHESSGSHPPAPPVGRGTSATVGSDVLAHSLPSATPIVPTGGEVTEASPLVAQTPESSAHPTAEIAASTGTLAEPGPLTSEGNAAGQVDATADAYSGLGSLPPPTSHEARAEPEALPSVDRTQLLAGGEQPGEEVRRGEHHSGREDGPPAALLREQTDRVSGEGGSGEEGGERWETVEREAHSSGSSERM